MEKGWQDHKEINRVLFDPQQVNIEKMVKWLEAADTYRGTLTNSHSNKGDQP